MRRAAALIVMAASITTGTAAWNGDVSPHTAEHVLTVTYQVDDGAELGPRVLAAAMDEARAVWAPYGVTLEPVSDPGTEACLSISIEDDRTPGDRDRGPLFTLGTIDFSPGGLPEHRIHVSMGSIRQLFREDEGHERYELGPAALSQYVVARAVGRVIAHEVGHFLLRFPSHVAAGLMATRHSPGELASGDRRAFALTRMLEPRLRQTLAQSACDCLLASSGGAVTPAPPAPACAEQ